MKRGGVGPAWITLLVALACRGSDDAAVLAREGARREAALATRLAAFDTSWAPLARWILPRALAEISGLTLLPDGRLVAHDDEFGRLSIVDARRGLVTSTFQLEGRNTRDDFEGITLVGREFHMLSSHGRIYVFGEGRNGTTVPFRVIDTGLGESCEFEAIAYDPESTDLLLPCKRVGEKRLRDHLVIHLVPTPVGSAPPHAPLVIPLDRLRHLQPWRSLHPTDVTRDPTTGTFVLVASPERALVEIALTGEVLRAVTLPEGHDQAEGVALTNNGMLAVSDEAVSRPAAITLYRWPPRHIPPAAGGPIP